MTYVSQMQSMGVIIPNRQRQAQVNYAQQQQQQAPQVAQQDHLEIISKLQEALQYQAVQFQRYKDITDRKFTSLSKDLLDITMQLRETQKVMGKIKDKHDTAQARADLMRYQQGDRAPADMPIDRNGVSPKDVQIADIFNCSGKRF